MMDQFMQQLYKVAYVPGIYVMRRRGAETHVFPGQLYGCVRDAYVGATMYCEWSGVLYMAAHFSSGPWYVIQALVFTQKVCSYHDGSH